MGEALIKGILQSGLYRSEQVMIAEPNQDRRVCLEKAYAVRTSSVSDDLWRECATVILAVKPQIMGSLLADARGLANGRHLIITIAAGLPLSFYGDALGSSSLRIIRVMPNTPAELGVGMSVISAGAHASEADLARAVSLMEAVGKAVVIPESHQDAATAISGSGPAYIFYVAEALADAGVLLGLPRAVATALATQTLLGSSTLLDASGQHATLLRERVTSPGGTTAAALRVLDDRAVKAAFIAAAEACRDRSAELGR